MKIIFFFFQQVEMPMSSRFPMIRFNAPSYMKRTQEKKNESSSNIFKIAIEKIKLAWKNLKERRAAYLKKLKEKQQLERLIKQYIQVIISSSIIIVYILLEQVLFYSRKNELKQINTIFIIFEIHTTHVNIN